MISISPGHYGPRTGASGYIDEGTEAIRVSKRVTEILRASKVTTNYIQDAVSKGQNANINWLVAQHNKSNRKIDVSIHFNSSAGTQQGGIGTEVLIYSGKNNPVAIQLSRAISAAGNFKNRGAKIRTNLGILKNTNRPCYLIEVCFVNSKFDADSYKKNFEAICQAIAKALADAVGKSLNSPPQSPVDSPKEVDIMSQPFKPTSHAISKAVQDVIFSQSKKQWKKDTPYLSDEWRKKYLAGDMTISDAIGLIYVMIDRGAIELGNKDATQLK